MNFLKESKSKKIFFFFGGGGGVFFWRGRGARVSELLYKES